MFGLSEGLFDVPKSQPLMIVAVVIDEGVLRVGFVDRRGAGFQRLLHVEHGRQRLVIEANPGHRLVGFAEGVGDHGDDRLALVAHLVDRESRLVVEAEVDQRQQRVEVARHVLAADDAAHAGRALRFAEIDASQARMCVGAAQHFQMRHALQKVIVEEG